MALQLVVRSPLLLQVVNGHSFFKFGIQAQTLQQIFVVLNQNTTVSGNDFMIDDIGFVPICVTSDTVVVTYNANPSVNLGVDTTICEGESIQLDAQNSGSNYTWQNGSGSQTLLADTAGQYYVDVIGTGNCTGVDSISVSVETPPNAGIDTSLTFCNSENLVNLNGYLSQSASTGGRWSELNSSTSFVLLNGDLNVAGVIEHLQLVL